MLEAQIAQQGTSLSTLSGKRPSKPKRNPHEPCNCVILKGGLEDSKCRKLRRVERRIEI